VLQKLFPVKNPAVTQIQTTPFIAEIYLHHFPTSPLEYTIFKIPPHNDTNDICVRLKIQSEQIPRWEFPAPTS